MMTGFDSASGVTTRMPRPSDQRSLWLGAGDAWTWVAEIVTATGVWAAIGYGLDRAFGTWPVLFAIGAIAGHAVGIYILWRRMKAMEARNARDRREQE